MEHPALGASATGRPGRKVRGYPARPERTAPSPIIVEALAPRGALLTQAPYSCRAAPSPIIMEVLRTGRGVLLMVVPYSCRIPSSPAMTVLVFLLDHHLIAPAQSLHLATT